DHRAQERVCHQGLARSAARSGPHGAGKQAAAGEEHLRFRPVHGGTQFYGLFGMVLSLYRQNKFPGIGQMFRYTLRDESNHIEVFRNLFMDLIEENRDIWTSEFKEELRGLMREAVALEKDFIRDCLPVNGIGLRLEDFLTYIDYIADRRLEGCGLAPLS